MATSHFEECACVQISAVVAVGLVEGLGQVNWRKVALIAAWWFLGPFPIIVAALFIFWQGNKHRSYTLAGAHQF